jgi:hypothetical protein
VSQGRRIIQALKRRPLTYMEMQSLGISTSPQKRVVESIHDDERLVKGERSVGGRVLVTWYVVKVAT